MSLNITFVHLLNDFSGSPKVLRNTIMAVMQQTTNVQLVVSSHGKGFLSHLDIPKSHYWYLRTGTRALTLFTYLLSQCLLFNKLLRDRSIAKDAVIYVNTLLPFGAALYGKLTRRKVIYHVHEISITPAPLKAMLTSIARMTSSLNLYVSDTHMQTLTIPDVPAQRVYNSLDADFMKFAENSRYSPAQGGYFNILMVASLRDYKGVPELLLLAERLCSVKTIRFDLVVNDDEAAISRYFQNRSIPGNLTIHPRTTKTTTFYAKASLVLNLSRVDQWIETFGLTILEAMAFGIPVIVPPVGGPIELVDNRVQGFLVDSRNSLELYERVLQLSNDQQLCERMSEAGRQRAAQFSPENFTDNIVAAINQVRTTPA